MRYFSIKRNWIISLAVFILIAVAFVFLRSKNEKNSIIFKRNNKGLAEKEFNLLASKDSDNDGLRDWEEALWKTEPNNPDSDGDGTQDGKEVREGRDPAKPAPNDKIEKIDYVAPPVLNETKYTPPTTATEVLVEEYLKQYVELKKTGDGEVTETSKQVFLDTIMKKISKKTPVKARTHKITEIKVFQTTKNNEHESLKKYGNEVVKIFIDSLANSTENEIEIINAVFPNKEEITDDDIEKAKEALGRLDIVILAYKNIISDLLKVETPSTASAIHLDIINEYERIKSSLESISVFFTDTLRGVAGVSAYFKRVEELQKKGEKLKNIFNAKEITFNTDEYGILFFNSDLNKN